MKRCFCLPMSIVIVFLCLNSLDLEMEPRFKDGTISCRLPSKEKCIILKTKKKVYIFTLIFIRTHSFRLGSESQIKWYSKDSELHLCITWQWVLDTCKVWGPESSWNVHIGNGNRKWSIREWTCSIENLI